MAKPNLRFNYRQQYDDAADAFEREVTAIHCTDESKTIISAVDTDINSLIKRMGISDGSILPTQLGQPIGPEYYGDFSDVPDLRGVLDNARNVNSRFAELPAKVRARFHNDPYELYEFVTDPANIEEGVELGLLTRPAPEPTPEPKNPTPETGVKGPDTTK